MRRIKVLLSLILLTAAFSSSYAAYLPWPMHMGNPQRTGLFTPTIGERGTMDSVWVKWRKTLSAISASPAIGDIDGDNNVEVIVGGTDGRVYALTGMYGITKWSRVVDASTYASGAAISDIDGDSAIEVVIGTLNGTVYALNGNGGAIKWSTSVGSELATSPVIGNVDANVNTIEIAVHTKTTLTCLNGVGGSVKWTAAAGRSSGEDVYSSPAIGDIDGNTSTIEVVVAANDTGVHAFNGSNGAQIWKCTTDHTGGPMPTPPWLLYTPSIRDLDNDGNPEVLLYHNFSLYVINGSTGAIKTGRLLSCPYSPGANTGVSTADVNSDGKCEIFTRYKVIMSLGPDSCNLLWSYAFPSSDIVHSNPVLADVEGDGQLEVVGANHGGYVACLEAESGALKWSIYVPNTSTKDIHPTNSFGDIDGDGCFEIVGIVNEGIVYTIESDCPTNVEESKIKVDKAELKVFKTDGKVMVNFTIPQTSKVVVSVFDISGSRKANTTMGILNAGSYSTTFDINGLTNNVYFVRLNFNDKYLTRKLVLVK